MRPPRSRRVRSPLPQRMRGYTPHTDASHAAASTTRSAARRPATRSATRFVALLAAAALVGTTLALALRIDTLPHTRAPAVRLRTAPAEVAERSAAAPPGYPAAAAVGAALLRRAGAFAADHLPHRATPAAQSAEAAVRPIWFHPRSCAVASACADCPRRSSCALRRRRRSRPARTRRTAWLRAREKRARQQQRAAHAGAFPLRCLLRDLAPLASRVLLPLSLASSAPRRLALHRHRRGACGLS
jgi:hypothetical protein